VTSIFLSYARADDEAFTRRLYLDLVASGFRVWFDREKMLTRGKPFPAEIREAVEHCDRFLLIVGPATATSEWCCAEWRHADIFGRPITPIIRMDGCGPAGVVIDGFDLIPDDLKLQELHADDFRDDRRYKENLALLIKQLGEPVAPPGKLVGFRPLPAGFLTRNKCVQEVRHTLLSDFRNPTVITGIHGMGGLGKSILAKLVARNPNVRRTFGDGVFWVPIGNKPNLLNAQHRLAQELGCSELRIQDVEQGRLLLGELLEPLSVLLVLDDVWSREAVHAFDLLGPKCRILITSQDAGLLTSIGSKHCQLGFLSDSEALSVLANASGLKTYGLPEEACEIARMCGNLPLALALCGGMVRRGIPWKGVSSRLQQAALDDVSERHRDPENPHHQSLRLVLQMSVDALSDAERERFLELCVFPAGTPVPESAVFLLWSRSGGLSRFQCEDLLISLRERSLLLPSTTEELAIHDLIRTFITQSACNQETLHREFSNAIWEVYTDHPDEFAGYIMDQLPTHLVAGKQPLRILDLLVDSRLNYFHRWAEMGMAATGLSCLETLVDELGKQTDTEGIIRQLATQLARLNNRLGRDGEAERWLNLALNTFRQGANPGRVEAVALHELGSLALSRRDFEAASLYYRRALHIAHKATPPMSGEVSGNLIGLATHANLIGRSTSRTIVLGRLALLLADREQDAPHAAEAYRILADAYKYEMRYPESESYFAQGMEIATREGLSEALLSLLTGQAWMHYQRAILTSSSISNARLTFRKLGEQAELRHDWRFRGEALAGLAATAYLDDCEESLEAAITKLQSYCRKWTRPHIQARLDLLFAERLFRGRRFAEAACALSHLAVSCRTLCLQPRLADALAAQGVALYHSGAREEAENAWREAAAVLVTCVPARQEILRRCIESCREEKGEPELRL